MMGPKGEKVCLISCSVCNNQRGKVRSDTLQVLSSWDDVGVPTRQSCADTTAVHRAVAGAGLVNHVIKAQLLGVACTESTDELLSESQGVARRRVRLHSYALS